MKPYRSFIKKGGKQPPNPPPPPTSQPVDTVAAPGVPALPWRLRLHCDDVKHYEGHAFVTADPRGLARSVCDGFVDDMAWIAQMHNALIIKSWRVRLARRLLRLPVRLIDGRDDAQAGT